MKRLLLTFVFSIALFSWADDSNLAYFKQFLYQKVSYQPDPDFPAAITHQYVSDNEEAQQTHPTGDGRWYKLDYALFLYENGTYDLVYQEFIYRSKNSPFHSLHHCEEVCS